MPATAAGGRNYVHSAAQGPAGFGPRLVLPACLPRRTPTPPLYSFTSGVIAISVHGDVGARLQLSSGGGSAVALSQGELF